MSFGDALRPHKTPPGRKVMLYANVGFSGATKVVTADNAFLSDL